MKSKLIQRQAVLIGGTYPHVTTETLNSANPKMEQIL